MTLASTSALSGLRTDYPAPTPPRTRVEQPADPTDQVVGPAHVSNSAVPVAAAQPQTTAPLSEEPAPVVAREAVPRQLATLSEPPPAAPASATNGLLLPGPGGDALRQAVKAARMHDGKVDLEKVGQVAAMTPYVPCQPEALADFVAPGVGRPAGDVKLKLIGGEGHTGHSGADIYFVQDRSGKKLGVLKIYPDLEPFGNELSGMVRLQEPDMRQVHGTLAMRAGRTDGPQGPRPMVLMTCAPGDSLNDLLIDVKNAPDAAGREQAWGTVQKAVAATARALATLHASAAGSGTRPPTDFIQKYVKEVQGKTAELLTHPEALRSVGLDGETLQRHVDNTIRGMKDDLQHGRVPNGLGHGDTHPGNFCYDPATDTVTFIDMNRMQRSMDENGGPRGCPAFDTTKLPQRLTSLAKECGLGDEEAGQLRQIFADSYRQAGGPAMPQSVVDFFDMRSAVAGALRKLQFTNPSEEGLSGVAQTRLGQLATITRNQEQSDTGVRNALIAAIDATRAGQIPHAVDSEVLSDHYPAVKDLLSQPLTPFDTPKLIAERQRQVKQRYELLQQNLAQTSTIQTPERQELRQQIVSELYGDPGTRQKGKEAWVIIGGPGCGKSTLSNDIQTAHGALVIDGDQIRARLPEFQKYELTDQVRDEKRALQAALRDKAAANGENMILSFSPNDVKQVANPIAELQKQGYTVHVQLVTVPLEVGVERAAYRFDVTGRWSDCFDDKILGRKAEAVYRDLQQQGIGNSFEAYANDVPDAKPHRIADTDPLITGTAA